LVRLAAGRAAELPAVASQRRPLANERARPQHRVFLHAFPPHSTFFAMIPCVNCKVNRSALAFWPPALYNERVQIQGGVFPMAYVISDDCIACGACAEECPVSAISEGDGKYVIDADTCISCGACAGTCPVSAPHEA